MNKLLGLLAICSFAFSVSYSQNASSTIPVSIGMPCGNPDGITDSFMYFNYNRGAETIDRLSSCRPTLASPGISAYNTSISFNPSDGYLYFVRYNSSGSYIWRWNPETCPVSEIPVYQFYPNQMILGLDFDATGMGYQIIFTGYSAPFGLALQKVDFTTGTFGPIINIDLQGKQINTQNGDMVITSGDQFLMVWDNLYFSLNYHDYNTSTPLIATYISTVALPGSTKLVGLAFAQGKLVGSASDCGYYDFNMFSGKLANLTKGPGLQWSTDMTNITSGIGAAKKLVSATPAGNGIYDLVYDVTVKNYGDYPISNLQVTEDLTTLHPSGASVISNVSAEWVSNPAGLIKNPSFNGVTDKKLIASSPAQTLPVFPRAFSSFVIRIKCRLSSVQTGVVYYNSVVAKGNGYNNVSLQDSSTNGLEPDLNSNNKPDDAGESQPTPFSVDATAEYPPCTDIHSILYKQDFGSGTGVSTILPGTVASEYAPGSNPLDEESYLLTNNASNGNASKFINLTDHTASSNGRMLLINADVQNYKMFEDIVSVSCANLKYSFLLYAVNAANNDYTSFCSALGAVKYPRLTLVVRNADNNHIITSYSTGDITSNSWQSYGMKWVMPIGITRVKLQIYNTGEGGCGNIIGLDDIQFGLCDPDPSVSATLPSAGCKGQNATINANLSDTTNMAGFLQYQWQKYNNSTSQWDNINNATSTSFTINNFSSSDVQYYRIAVAATGNLGNDACQYVSNSLLVSLKDSSTSAAFITSNKPFVCPGEPAILTVSGGSLGTNAVWKWYQSSCGGTYLASGTSITVHPLSTSKYYVSAQGDCNTTQCVFITMPQLCILAEESVDLKGFIQMSNSNLSFIVISDKKIKTLEVEKSTDGANFTTIKSITVNDYPDSRGYNLKDNISADRANTFYYRVKINGDNASSYYSKILQLTRSGNNFSTTVSPNPANEKIKISFYTSEVSSVEIKLFNVHGQVVKKENIISTEGINNYFMNGLGNLPSGIYNLSIASADKISHEKVIIQR